MPDLSELVDYKKTIGQWLYSDRGFVDLVTNTTTMTLPARSLVNDQLWYYDYIDETVQDAKCYVCLEIDDSTVRTPAVGDFVLLIWIIVPKSLMDMQGNIRRDAIASRIDTLLNGSSGTWFGEIKKLPSQRFSPNASFRGRLLKYSVQGWNRHGETLAEH